MTSRREGPATGLHDALREDPALVEALADWRTRGRLSNDAVRALKTRRRRTATAGVGGVAAMVMALALVPYHAGPVPDRIARIETGRGEIRKVRLPDGTTIRIDGATRLSVRYGAGERVVALATGAAWFDVAHDPRRPFTVHAGDGDVRVLGTAFRVDRTAGRMDLAVYRGAVRLAGRGDDRAERVTAGWRAQVVRGHARIPVRFDPTDSDGRGDWLDTDGLPLADLVSVLNRRSGKLILPPPLILADLPISGRFRIDEPEKLLASLGSSYGFRLIYQGDRLLLSPI